jgi:hypothetical protein
MTTPKYPFSLAHWRQTVAEIYAAVRGAPPLNQPQAWELYRSARDNLFRAHPQTPLTSEQHCFNYAYNPSCAYNAQWDCPLAPLENWLPFAVEAGEKAFTI